MKKFTFVLSLFLFVAKLSTAQNLSEQAHKIDTISANAGAEFVKNGPGRAISIGVIQNGKIYLHNYGTIEKGVNHHPTNQTLYEIGSMTKTFTSIILAHAVLEKRVKPDDDIRKYLNGSYPNLEYAGKPIQLIHIVNLTSGLPNNMPIPPDALSHMRSDSMAAVFIKLHAGYTREKFLQELHTVKLDTLPGINPRHSNAAAELLGYILENVYHQSLPALIKKYITGPLGMSHTFLTTPPANLARAKGYTDRGDLMPYIPYPDNYAFGMESTVEDMTKYIQFHLEEKDPAVKITHQAAWGNINQFALGWNWFMGTSADGKRSINNDGTTLGFTAATLLYPAQHFAVMLLTNEYDNNSNDRLEQSARRIYEECNYTLAERSSLGFGFSPAINKLLSALNKQGFDHAEEAAAALKKSDPKFDLPENDVNNWAYFLMRKGKQAQAHEIFKLNVALYPQSGNTYDSLAESYANMGNKELAIKNYKRSLELNPQNTNAVEQLKKLQ